MYSHVTRATAVQNFTSLRTFQTNNNWQSMPNMVSFCNCFATSVALDTLSNIEQYFFLVS